MNAVFTMKNQFENFYKTSDSAPYVAVAMSNRYANARKELAHISGVISATAQWMRYLRSRKDVTAVEYIWRMRI